jgi:hypothetical protein
MRIPGATIDLKTPGEVANAMGDLWISDGVRGIACGSLPRGRMWVSAEQARRAASYGWQSERVSDQKLVQVFR